MSKYKFSADFVDPDDGTILRAYFYEDIGEINFEVLHESGGVIDERGRLPHPFIDREEIKRLRDMLTDFLSLTHEH